MGQTTNTDKPQWHIPAAIAGWLIPGGGHALIGEKHRGLILFIGIGGLWLTGLLIGGISVIDKAQHPAWYGCQILTSPSIIVEIYHRSLNTEDGKAPLPEGTSVRGMPAPTPSYEPSLNHVHEQGTIFTALAGLLNLLAIFDVVYRHPHEREEPQEHAATTGAGSHA